MSDRPAETEYSALQALLQIRSNSSQGESGATREEAGGGASDSAGTANANQNASTNTSTTASANNIANLLRMGVSSASLLQATTQVPYTAAQLAAVRAAVASNFGRNGLLQAAALQNPSFSVAAAAAAAANRTDLAGATLHRSPLLEAMARDPSLAAAAVATAPLSPALELPRSPALSPIRPSTSRGPSSSSGTGIPKTTQEGPTTADSGNEETEKEKKIRKEEVEAALRSKPQRGRKRENLNAEERLELTRTRNREHAKSTRIRKKARYQELLDTEQKYLEIKSEEELNGTRRESVMKFLDARARMLSAKVRRRAVLAADEASGEANRDADQELRRASENRAVSFDHVESLNLGSSLAHGTADEVSARLREILENVGTFRFETSVAGIHVHDYDAMAQFDDFVLGRFHDILVHGSSCRLYYRVIGSARGIALNKDGTGFARVELVAALTSEVDPSSEASSPPKENEKTLQSSVVSFQFAKASPLISSISWCSMRETMESSSPPESVNENKSDSTAKESLESQTVYPSVVSFDETHRDKARESVADQTPQGQHENAEQSEENPGMSI